MSALPDGWREDEDQRASVIAAWCSDGPDITEVSLHDTGLVEVDAFMETRFFPVELMVHIQAAWHNHLRGKVA